MQKNPAVLDFFVFVRAGRIVPRYLIRYAHKILWTQLASLCDKLRCSIPHEATQVATYLAGHKKKPVLMTDFFFVGAGRENRTPIYCLEGSHFTIKLCPQYF